MQRSYRTGPQPRLFVLEEVKNTLSAAVIELSQSDWAWHVVMTPKLNLSYRCIVDCWNLNAVSIRDIYALPRRDDCTDSLREAIVFSILDANWGIGRSLWRKPTVTRPPSQVTQAFTVSSTWSSGWWLPRPLSSIPWISSSTGTAGRLAWYV